MVAVDGSEQATRALDYALDVASATDGELTVVHAVDPSVYEETASSPIAERSEVAQHSVIESIEDAEERGREVIEDAAARAEERGARVDTVLLYGDPVEEIPAFADEGGVDAVIVGHRGLSAKYERVLGSVAKGILAQSSVPVTVVP